MRTLSWSKFCLFGARYKDCYGIILPRLRRVKEQNQLNFTEGKCKYGYRVFLTWENRRSTG